MYYVERGSSILAFLVLTSAARDSSVIDLGLPPIRLTSGPMSKPEARPSHQADIRTHVKTWGETFAFGCGRELLLRHSEGLGNLGPVPEVGDLLLGTQPGVGVLQLSLRRQVLIGKRAGMSSGHDVLQRQHEVAWLVMISFSQRITGTVQTFHPQTTYRHESKTGACFASSNSWFVSRNHRKKEVCDAGNQLNCRTLISSSYFTAS